MKETYEVLGAVRVIQESNGTAKVQISNELNEDIPMYMTFLAMNIEVFANKLNLSIDEVLALIKQNIEVEPMEFDQQEKP
ncbi:hypothetical protein K5E_21990 [Enterococcus thailandicus]|uniref:hypothetical protein n=1 Tax=Enterococcus thailandicus TaxID=417368 RepID=UPI00244D943E|nr:hypothetical protein [Enterococcus thailandicus]GMC02534.1 hypothetical protein K4E_00440 [Enterococcus thailandicus]GMC10060.1 hypothetical protein K5E_21990 [Enterococcus thailandicus]